MPRAGDILSRAELQENFAELPPPLTDSEALVEAARCLYCFDAPCTRACPTEIDVPKFIRQILHRNEPGAARTILQSNIFGGSCARACPTEVLCEGACVDNTLLNSPVQIGRLQRHACDVARQANLRFFTPGPPTGRRVAIIGSGPAGLSCAHELRKAGHEVVVFEARGVAGGLNTLGIAAYKITTEFALTEVDLVQQVGVEIRRNSPQSGPQIQALLAGDEFDSVFLGIGLGRTRPLGIPGEDAAGVWEALDFIFQTHTGSYADCQVGQHVLVIGAGNTAADVATEAVRLGAEQVTLAYRRGDEAMPAYAYEYEYMKHDGVHFEWYAQPKRVVVADGKAVGVEFIATEPLEEGSRKAGLREVPGSEFTIEADMIVKALGQAPLLDLLKSLPDLKVDGDCIAVDPDSGATSIAGLFAGGDCISGGAEIVNAVQDGKVAAAGINRYLAGARGGSTNA